MKHYAMFLVVLGVCVAALGASGFHTPGHDGLQGEPYEPYALAYFAAGIAMLGTGGYIVHRVRRETSTAGAGGEEKRAYLDEIDTIRRIVTNLDARKGSLAGADVRDEIGRLMSQEYFDLTSKSDDLVQLIGFAAYARVWEGIANAERLLQRCWSMCTDGYYEEGIEELPLARIQLEHALAAMRGV